MMIDLEDSASLEKLGNALLNIPSFVVSMAKRAMEIQESRDIILNTVFNSDKFVQNVDFALLDSESKVLPRLKDVEIVTGLNALYLEDEDHAPTLPERIEALEKKNVIANGKPSEPEPEVTPVIETIRDMKTCALVEYLKTEAKPNDFGQFVIGRKELDTFMRNIIEEGLRVKKVSRQLKADLFERAVKLFPDVVYIKKSPSGNKTKMLALKESAKRTITHGLTRKAPLGILI
ncbi:MAG: hypothetical protein ACYDEF_10705 [Methanosarcina sp.]